MNEGRGDYGATRSRAANVSFAEIEAAARRLMAEGTHPTVAGVLKALKRGSTSTIAEAMRRFWKNQAALNRGDPVALTNLPSELAEAARAQWEKALLLAQQTAKHDDNAARAHLAELQRDNELRARSFDLREKEWELAARVRERALADAREYVNLLMKELATDRAELRARDTRLADLESQLEDCRKQLAVLITRAVARNRAIKAQRPRLKSRAKRKARAVTKKRAKSKQTRRRAKR